ncbi:MAG: Crp/Fnr family transcriptional regulator [Ekhidna sp.]|nr:Crp/Fnr family transcriptional regulator [Ekhidna sp.]
MLELSDIIQSIYPLGSRSTKDVLSITTEKQIASKERFIEKGKRNQSEYFLMDGICRSFLLSPEGEEITLSFFNAGSVLSPYVTRTQNDRSLLNFEALTDITIAEMNAGEFLELMVKDVETREFGNMVLRMELQKKAMKEIYMASLTARERLQRFREEYPGFENMIPHPIIATYLGITNVSLSRLRKERF